MYNVVIGLADNCGLPPGALRSSLHKRGYARDEYMVLQLSPSYTVVEQNLHNRTANLVSSMVFTYRIAFKAPHYLAISAGFQPESNCWIAAAALTDHEASRYTFRCLNSNGEGVAEALKNLIVLVEQLAVPVLIRS